MRVVGPLLLILVVAVPLALLRAQSSGPQASQHGIVSQTVNGTVITLEYDRPVARGRDLFGGVVPWAEVWAPGANRTSWIEVSTPVTLEGQELEAGRYGIWVTPAEQGPWELALMAEWDTDHLAFPAGTDAIRSAIQPEQGAHMETLAFYFPTVGPYESTLRLHWGTTILPIQIEVPR